MALPADLILYASANMPADDSATSGGAIDLDTRVELTQPASATALEAVSSAAGDTTQTLTVRARDATDAVVSQTVTLTGTSVVSFSTLGSVTRVLKVNLSADAAGTVTLRAASGGATVGTIPIGERGFLCVHREATAQAGSQQLFYYKVFIKNTGASTLSTPVISEVSDAVSRCTFALAATLNDSGSVTNRKTAPAALSFTNADKSAPASLTAGDACGIWLLFTHPAGDAEMTPTLTMGISGS